MDIVKAITWFSDGIGSLGHTLVEGLAESLNNYGCDNADNDHPYLQPIEWNQLQDGELVTVSMHDFFSQSINLTQHVFQHLRMHSEEVHLINDPSSYEHEWRDENLEYRGPDLFFWPGQELFPEVGWQQDANSKRLERFIVRFVTQELGFTQGLSAKAHHRSEMRKERSMNRDPSSDDLIRILAPVTDVLSHHRTEMQELLGSPDFRYLSDTHNKGNRVLVISYVRSVFSMGRLRCDLGYGFNVGNSFIFLISCECASGNDDRQKGIAYATANLRLFSQLMTKANIPIPNGQQLSSLHLFLQKDGKISVRELTIEQGRVSVTPNNTWALI